MGPLVTSVATYTFTGTASGAILGAIAAHPVCWTFDIFSAFTKQNNFNNQKDSNDNIPEDSNEIYTLKLGSNVLTSKSNSFFAFSVRWGDEGENDNINNEIVSNCPIEIVQASAKAGGWMGLALGSIANIARRVFG